ncbi:MAG: hypothetical protein NTY02_11215 [Acidobacteria bacterium]|nr:hypothetical protein [Acidobacteriota bacterium]
MRRVALVSALSMALMLFATAPRAQDKGEAGMALRPVAQTPEWQKLRSLVGQWAGVMEEAGQQVPADAEVRMTADGSALMHVLGKDTPHEMVTMFHPDLNRLLATHYCAAHNQPRMALTKAPGANQLAFEFVDGTNIAPGDGYMARLVITFQDADHHDEAWTFRVNGKDGPAAVFRFARKK